MGVPQLDEVNFVYIMGWNQRNTIGALGKTQKKSNQYILQLAGIGPPSGFFFSGGKESSLKGPRGVEPRWSRGETRSAVTYILR